MEIAPPTNTTLSHIADALLECESVCVCGHVNPDGDCIGSALALCDALASLGKRVTPLLASEDALHPSFAELPGIERCIPAARFEGAIDAFVSVDVSSDARIGQTAAALKARASRTIVIDHHEVDEVSCDLAYIVPSAPSTTMLVWDLVAAMGTASLEAVATCCFFGLMTDTGGFRHANASSDAFAYAAAMVRAGADPNRLSDAFFQRRSLASLELEARTIDRIELICDGRAALSFVTQADLDEVDGVKADCEPLIDILRSLDGVKVSCLLKCFGGDVRGSLRSKDGIDVNAIARELGGGGHLLASGFTLVGASLSDARERVTALIEAAVG